MSRWDRPPEPHDWRYFVGGLGRTLIAVGMLMFGFVGYQLWGTGLETARAQNRLENRFEDAIANASAAAAVPTPTPTPTPTVALPGTTLPVPAATVAPTVPTASTTPIAPSGTQTPVIEEGQPLARLEIPAIDQDVIVVPGVDHESLKMGPGHYPDTPLPGQLGNAAIAGHRTTWSEPFARIDELEPGDEIVVTMLTGDRFVYVVDSTVIVSPSDYWIVGTTDPTVAQLTLTSCHPRWSASQRIAVTAFLAPDVSAPVGQPTFYDLEANGSDATTSTGTDAGINPGALPTTLPGGAVDDPTVSVPATGDEPSITRTVDGLTEGWFDDAGAWPQILLWGLVCAAIARIAYLISRRLRSYPIGWAISVVPFLVALYFLYQNINRLLPPGL